MLVVLAALGEHPDGLERFCNVALTKLHTCVEMPQEFPSKKAKS
jgi:hypothetical protein